MASEFEFHALCLYDQMDKVMKNTTHATSALDTRMARIETALTVLNASHMNERLALDSKIEAIDAKIDMLTGIMEVILAKIAALDEKMAALGQAKEAGVREEVPPAPDLDAFGDLSVEEQWRMQQRGSEY
jgi:hypothetical protein